MLQRFTKVEDQLLKMEKNVPTGKEITYCHYDGNGVLQKTYSSTDLKCFFTFHYDEEGRIVEKKLFRTGSAEPEAVCTYKYDKNGNCTRYQNENGSVSTFKYTYDDAGVVVEGPRVEFLPEGTLNGDSIRYTYEYDAEGKVIRMAGQQTNGKDISYEFVYDDQGRVVNATHIMPEGNVTEDYRYEADRLAEKRSTLKDGTTVQTYTYGTRYIFDTEGLS
jgi:YD repeat-containing protein